MYKVSPQKSSQKPTDTVEVRAKLKKYLFSISIASLGKKKTSYDEKCYDHSHLRPETVVLCSCGHISCRLETLIARLNKFFVCTDGGSNISFNSTATIFQ